jgi:hypothetical protein
MNKFTKNEVVLVSSNEAEFKEINNSEGVVRTFDKNELGEWIYTVSVDADDGMLWCIEEDNLRYVGKHRSRDNVISGETAKITVDPKTGEGILVDDDQ